MYMYVVYGLDPGLCNQSSAILKARGWNRCSQRRHHQRTRTLFVSYAITFYRHQAYHIAKIHVELYAEFGIISVRYAGHVRRSTGAWRSVCRVHTHLPERGTERWRRRRRFVHNVTTKRCGSSTSVTLRKILHIFSCVSHSKRRACQAAEAD